MQYLNFISLNIFSIIILYSICLPKIKKLRKMEQSSQITIIIKGSGNQQILYKDFTNEPNSIFINENLQSIIKKNII